MSYVCILRLYYTETTTILYYTFTSYVLNYNKVYYADLGIYLFT